jgi:sigma-B regulation protein RsbU (phosphoserine phosphatase)
MKASQRTGSLAGSIIRMTLLVGVATLAAALIVTVVGSYRLAASQSRERIGAYLDLMQTEITSRLSEAATHVEHSVRTLEAVSPDKVTSRLLASQYVAGSELLENLVLLTEDGHIVESYPALDSKTPTSTFAFASDLGSSETEVHYSPAVAGQAASLWAVRHVRLSDGQRRLLLGRVRTGFLRSTADRVSSEGVGRSAEVVEGDTVVVAGARGPGLRLSSADYGGASGGQPGQLQITAPTVGLMRGLWVPLTSPPGLKWRALVAEPARATISTSLRASIPTFLVLLFGGLMALAAAWVVAGRVVKPLRELESASNRAAEGAYVSRIESGRDDEVGRLVDAFNAVGLRLNALHDVSRLLAGASRLDQVLDAITESVVNLLGPGVVAIYLVDPSQQSLALARASSGSAPPHGPVLRVRAGAFAEALRTGRVQTPDPRELPMRGWDVGEGPSRALVAPLIAGTEQIGVVVVVQLGRSAYSEAETEMLHTFASQAAVGIAKSRLFEREIDSRHLAESLRDIAEELVRSVEFADALSAVSTLISRILGGKRALLAFEDREALGLPDSYDPDLEEAVLQAAVSTVADGGAPATVVRGGSPATDELLERLGGGEMIVARLEPNEPYQGALLVVAEEGEFLPTDLELIEGAVKILTLALDNAYFFERSRARAKNLETIFRISQAVGSSLQLKVVLNRVLDVVQMIFAADAVSLMTYDATKRTVSTAMARGAISADILHLEVEPGEDLPGRVFSRGEPVMLRDVDASMLPLARSAARVGLRSLLSVPLLARGSAVGVLTVFSAHLEAFDEEDMGLLQTFGSQAALAIDTARLYSKEHEVAATLQRNILPEKAPTFDEVEAATAYEPAGEEAEIGGDYYDLFRAPDGRLVVAMADVCGKGVEAATKTSMLKYSIRALVAAGLGPAACLDEINDMVAANEDPSDILTVWLGYVDPADRRLVFANGGHPPGLLYRSSKNDVVRLAPTGPILGAAAKVDFGEEEIDVAGGDVILLYTDGVTEARSGNKFFGEGRVRRVLRYGGSAKSVVEHLLGALSRFSPGTLRDDVAIVALRVKETGNHPAQDLRNGRERDGDVGKHSEHDVRGASRRRTRT